MDCSQASYESSTSKITEKKCIKNNKSIKNQAVSKINVYRNDINKLNVISQQSMAPSSQTSILGGVSWK